MFFPPHLCAVVYFEALITSVIFKDSEAWRGRYKTRVHQITGIFCAPLIPEIWALNGKEWLQMYPKYVIKFHVDFYSIGSGQNHRCTLCSPVPFLAFLFHAVVISAFVSFTSLWVQRWKWKKWCSSQGHFATWEQLPSKEHIMNSFITFWLVFPTCCRLLHMLSAHFSSSVFFFFPLWTTAFYNCFHHC